jgi:EmrB/QacA subfamily drug resistance transporter
LRQTAQTGNTRLQTATIVTITISAFMTAFSASATNIALPTIAVEFNLDAIRLSWIALAYMLATAALVMPMGRTGDIYGRKKIFILGTLLFIAGSILCAMSHSIVMLIASRVVQGIGASMQFGTGMAITTSVFPPDRRGAALGLNTASVYVGLSAGPVVGGFLTHEFGWQSIFLLSLPLGLIILVLTCFLLKGEWKDSEGESLDLPGALAYGVALVCLLLGLSNITTMTGAILMAASAVLFIVLWMIENRVRYPIFNLRLFKRNRAFTFSNLAALINYSATFGVGFLMSLYLQNIRGFTPQHSGAILLTQPLIMAVFSPLTGKLSDTIEPTILASLGMLLTAGGLFMMSFLAVDTPLWFMLTALITLGAGFALFSSPNTNAVMHALDRRDFGVGGATLSTARIIGQILSLGIATVIFSVLLGDAKISAANQAGFLQSLTLTFRIFTGLCLAGIYFSMARGNVHRAAQ